MLFCALCRQLSRVEFTHFWFWFSQATSRLVDRFIPILASRLLCFTPDFLSFMCGFNETIAGSQPNLKLKRLCRGLLSLLRQKTVLSIHSGDIKQAGKDFDCPPSGLHFNSVTSRALVCNVDSTHWKVVDFYHSWLLGIIICCCAESGKVWVERENLDIFLIWGSLIPLRFCFIVPMREIFLANSASARWPGWCTGCLLWSYSLPHTSRPTCQLADVWTIELRFLHLAVIGVGKANCCDTAKV